MDARLALIADTVAVVVTLSGVVDVDAVVTSVADVVGIAVVLLGVSDAGAVITSIRNAVLNDFSLLDTLCPGLEAIAHNGGESFKHSKLAGASLLGAQAAVRRAGPHSASTAPSGSSVLHAVKSVQVEFYKLPSSSPANASWSFERKLAAWREVFEKHGLV